MRWRSLNLLLGFILSFAFAGLLYGQRAGRGIITGLVIDPAGAAVPDATVTVTDQVTQFKTVVGSSSDGNYGTPLLPLGTYKVQVEKPGFKTYIREGIEITGGATYRQDVTLELGAVTQTVEVKAASEMINVQTADVSHTSTRGITKTFQLSWERISAWQKACCMHSQASSPPPLATRCFVAAGSTRG